jgi:hypothetical protein
MKTTIIVFVCLAFMLVAAESIRQNASSDPFEMAEHLSFNKPDEVREFPLGKVELVKIGGAVIGRATFEPGWRWSTSVKPMAKTDLCEAPHYQYHISGTLRILMEDGSIFDCMPGDLSNLPSGHDAWVVGDEPAVLVDFQGMVDYAKMK